MTTPDAAVDPGLRSLVAELAELDPEEIDPDTAFPDLGIDSLLAMEIALHAERRYGVRFHEGDLTRVRSLRDLARLVAERGHG